MMNMNRGYSGWSMSNRAVEAYDNGEMPLSKWTKSALLSGIADALDYADLLTDDNMAQFAKYPVWFLRERFLHYSGWHHTSKYCNITDFYEIDERAICDYLTDEDDRRMIEKAYEAANSERKALAKLKKLGIKRSAALVHNFAANGYRMDLLYTNATDSLLWTYSSRKTRNYWKERNGN